MDDNKKNNDENQINSNNQQQNQPPVSDSSQNDQNPPIFESVPVADNSTNQPEQPLQPEEVPPEIETPSSEGIGQEPNQLPSDAPPVMFEENKNKYFIIIAGVVFFVIVLLILLKVLFGGGSKPQAVNLTYGGLWVSMEVFQPLIDQYHSQHPNVKVTYQMMDPQEYRDKLIARSQNGQGPDIFRFHNTWLPEISQLAAPIPGSVMPNSEFEKTFYKVAQQDLKVGNYYYGLPLEIDGLVLIYNDNLLKKAGIQSPPATWDDLTNDVTKLTVKDRQGNLITSGIALGTTSNVEHYSDIFGLMLMQNGGDIKKLDQPEAAGALEIYRKFAEEPQGFWSDNMPDSITAFIQEKVAMIIAPSWDVLMIKSANPDISVKVSAVPSVPGSPALSIANYWVEGVSKYSKNQLEAWKFLKYLTQKDSMTKLYEIETKTRLFGEPYSRVDMAQLLVQNEYIGPVIKQADSFVSIPTIDRTFDNGLNDQIDQYIKNAVNATIQGVSYSEALKTAQQGVSQVLNQYKIE